MRAAVLLFLGCSAPTITVAPAPEPRTLRVETWEVALRHTYNVTATSRVDAVADALLKTPEDVDVTCVTGIGPAAWRARVLATTTPRFPFVGFVKIGPATPPDDPRDFLGTPQPLDLTPACKTAEDIARVDALLACLREKCLGPDGTLPPNCGYLQCGSVLPRIPSWKCSACVDATLGTRPFDEVRTRCTEAPRGELANDGELAALILSKRPLRDVRAHVLPTTFDPRGAMSALVDVGSTAVRVYCADFTVQLFDPTVEYVGAYGAPLTGKDGWYAEFQLGFERTIDSVYALGREHPTIFLGHAFNLWVARSDPAETVQPAFHALAANFHPLIQPDPALCTSCPRRNELMRAMRTRGDDAFTNATFSTAKLEVSDVEIVRTEATHTWEGKPVTVSDQYGVRLTVRLP